MCTGARTGPPAAAGAGVIGPPARSGPVKAKRVNLPLSLRLRFHVAGAFPPSAGLAGGRNRRNRLGARRRRRGIPVWALAVEKIPDLVPRQCLEFEQALGQGLELFLLALDDPGGHGVAGLDQLADF